MHEELHPTVLGYEVCLAVFDTNTLVAQKAKIGLLQDIFIDIKRVTTVRGFLAVARVFFFRKQVTNVL